MLFHSIFALALQGSPPGITTDRREVVIPNKVHLSFALSTPGDHDRPKRGSNPGVRILIQFIRLGYLIK